MIAVFYSKRLQKFDSLLHTFQILGVFLIIAIFLMKLIFYSFEV